MVKSASVHYDTGTRFDAVVGSRRGRQLDRNEPSAAAHDSGTDAHGSETRNPDDPVEQLAMATQAAAEPHQSRAVSEQVISYLDNVIESLGVMYLLRNDTHYR